MLSWKTTPNPLLCTWEPPESAWSSWERRRIHILQRYWMAQNSHLSHLHTYAGAADVCLNFASSLCLLCSPNMNISLWSVSYKGKILAHRVKSSEQEGSKAENNRRDTNGGKFSTIILYYIQGLLPSLRLRWGECKYGILSHPSCCMIQCPIPLIPAYSKPKSKFWCLDYLLERADPTLIKK